MHVRLSEVDENYIKGKVESGFYTSENEVVRDACGDAGRGRALPGFRRRADWR